MRQITIIRLHLLTNNSHYYNEFLHYYSYYEFHNFIWKKTLMANLKKNIFIACCKCFQYSNCFFFKCLIWGWSLKNRGLAQWSKGIRQWPINWCTFPIMKVTLLYIKISGWNVCTLNLMNQPIKIHPKVV